MSDKKAVLEKAFTEIYGQLNEQQQTAVNTLEGPVMVIAGPGTGKTQILAARIGKILLHTDAQPENILCLTYTDAGVVAMRKRLQKMIGAAAYQVNIYTFHAFCNEVIQDNLQHFEKNELDPVSDLERIDFFRELINRFPKNHVLKKYRGDVYSEAARLQHLFSSMKREGWSPDWLREKIAAYLDGMKDNEAFIYKNNRAGQWKKGDLKPAYYDMQERMEKLLAAVNEYDNYQQIMQANNRYDFDDMINWVIRAFEKNENLLRSYQEKYQYILVDEYQDTSGTQNKIVQLLINFWEEPNVFVVGDDDQSIYRFQGANVENMLDFALQHSNSLRTIVLTDNYRSTQPILNISQSIIDKNAGRLIKKLPGLSKKLTAANTKINTLQQLPEIIEYNTVQEEMAGLTLQVQSLVEKGVPPGNIGVLYKENKYGEELANYFSIYNIPYYSKRAINLLATPFITKIITLLKYLNAEHDTPNGGDAYLFELLHYDFYQIPAMEIARLAVAANRTQYSDEPKSIRQLIYEKSKGNQINLFDKKIPEELVQAGNMLEGLIAGVPNLTIQQLVEAVINKGGILNYILRHPEKLSYLQMLTSFFDFIKEENRRNPRLSLSGLLQVIEMMEKEKLPLPMNRVTGNDSGVNLLTAHGSKGLEFEYVFLAGCNAAFWERKRKPAGGYTMPDTVFSQAKSSDEEELRRVFFVALTRAEKYLCLSYAKHKDDGKEMEASRFIAEIIEAYPDIKIQEKRLEPAQLAAFHTTILTGLKPVLPQPETAFIEGLLQKFTMNVTALNNYLSCPLKFYYQSLVKIPGGKSEAATFGSALHDALEKLFVKMKDNGQVFPPVEEMIKDFEKFMHYNRESFTQESYARRLEQGSIIIPEYYNKYINHWNKTVLTEMNIRNVIVDGVPLKGKLDKLEFTGKEVTVVDYKTGDYEKGLPKLKAPDEKQPNGGDYWRQAVFYKILLDNYKAKDWQVTSTEFDFIEPDKKKEYVKKKIAISPADVTTVKQQIKTSWEKIQRHDFYTGCGKEDCEWCNFTKSNGMYIRLLPQTEEQD